ncbi:ferrochelatase, partial [Tribonema minus]
RAGVLLCNLGGPEVNEDVEGFLFNLFSDKDIIRLPKLLSFLQRPIAKVLSQRRAPQSRAAYQSIGGGSPIVRWTNAQASALEVSLAQRGLPGTRCYVAMRYWHPYTAQALEEIAADGINTLVVLPLYPQFSISTSGSSLRVLREELERAPHVAAGMVHTVIKSWHDRPGYIAAVARQCVDEVLKLPADALARGATTVLFSAHGVPQSYIAEGDPYQTQVNLEARALLADTPAAAGADVAFELSYQSRVGPVEWLRPYTDDKIRDVARGGAESLVVVPISFVSEHIETLEEIDVEYRKVAEAAGIRNWRRVPALGTDARFIADLSAMVVEALVSPPLSV